MENILNFENLENILNDESETIFNIEQHGIPFIEQCYKNQNIYDKHKQIINDYHYQYIIGIIFDDSTRKYVSHLCTNLFLWEKFVSECAIDECIVDILFKEINESGYGLKVKCHLYRQLFNLKTEKFLIKHMGSPNSCKNIKLSLFGNLIDLIDEQHWLDNINLITNLITYIIKFTDVRTMTIKWFSHILNLNIERPNIKNIVPKTLCTDTFMYNITAILYNILVGIKFPPNQTEQRYIQVINHEYIYEQDCDLKWYDKNKDPTTKKYNLVTKIFFMLAKSVCISYVPILEYARLLESGKEDLIQMVEQSSPMAQFYQASIFNQLEKLDILINDNKILVQNDIMTNWMTNYFSNICDWIYNIKNKDFYVDDILSSLLGFLNINDQLYNDDNLVKVLFDVTKSKNITKNPDIRIKTCFVLRKICEHSLRNNIEFDTESYITNIMILHNELKNYKRELQDDINDRTKLYQTINPFVKFYSNKFPNMVENIVRAVGGSEIKNFVGILVADLAHVYTYCNGSESIIAEQNIEHHTAHYNKLIQMTHMGIQVTNVMFKTLKMLMLSPTFCKIIAEKDVIILLSAINLFVNKMHNYKYNYPYAIKNNNGDFGPKDNSVEINKVLHNICKITINIYSVLFDNNIDTPKNIVSSHSNFNTDTLDSLFDKFKHGAPRNFKKFIEQCHLMCKIRDEANDIEYPDEFLDALISTIIDEPVWMPDTTEDVVLNRSTATKCIVDNNKNPFTGKELSFEQFEEYNNTDEIKERAKQFIVKLDEWKKNNL